MSRLYFRQYSALFRIRFTNSLQYRVAALAAIFTNFAWGFMYILAFSAFYAENPEAFPMTWEQTVSYIWLQQAFLMFFAVWVWEKDIFATVESGDIAYELARPMDLYNKWAVTIAASRFARVMLRAIPILAVAFLLPGRFRLAFATDLHTVVFFFLSMGLGLAVMILFSMLIYISTFYTINSLGVRVFITAASDFFSGGIIPIPFFPDTVRFFVELSPFGAMQNTPLLIFSGYLQGADLLRALAVQVMWVAVLFPLGRFLMARSLGRVVTQGG
jgi:ABC-2 type transport system permease protein